jgi:transcriptional regulator with XRE-family HTH domain
MKPVKPHNSSQTIVSHLMPLPVKRAIEKFGADLGLARRRRRFSQASMAERIGVSVASWRRLEKGDPSLAWGTVVRALHVLGDLDKVTELMDTPRDTMGLLLTDAQLPKRIRRRQILPDSGGL